MADWTLLNSLLKYATYGGSAIASASAANTKGNWVQIVASTGRSIDSITLHPDYGDGIYDYLFDIAVGAAGSEVVIVSNILISTMSSYSYRGSTFIFPISIPAGTRISMRCQHNTDNAARNMYFNLSTFHNPYLDQKLPPPVTYGANTADSGGTQIDAGATPYTAGAYVQLTASTTRYHKGVVFCFGNISNAARTAGMFTVDLGIGGAGAEVVKLQSIVGVPAANTPPTPFCSIFYPMDIPIGSRLAIRCSSGITDATDRLLDVVVYCF